MTFQQLIEDIGYVTLRYTGRWMEGMDVKGCLGAIIEDGMSGQAALSFAFDLTSAINDYNSKKDPDSPPIILPEYFCTDSKMYDMIIYWLDIEYKENE